MVDELEFQELKKVVSACIDEIVQLKQEKAELSGQQNEQKILLNQMIQMQKDMIANMNAVNSDLERLMRDLKLAVQTAQNSADNMRYERSDPRSAECKLLLPCFYPIEKTVDELACGRKSIARFGDGEFGIMEGHERHKFQHPDSRLASRLREVIATEEEGFLIAIADNYGSLDAYNPASRRAIRLYMTDKVREEHAKYLIPHRSYHNAYISRPYAMYADNMTDAPRKRFDDLKRIWNGRSVIMVEGCLTKLGVGNDLFDNTEQIRRIEAPATHSFNKYDEILAAALKYAEPDILFLIALGPSAGVLAFDLYKAGYQAIDVGHVDLEYEWMLAGTGGHGDVPHKYNNEWPGGENVREVYDEKYESEVICRI